MRIGIGFASPKRLSIRIRPIAPPRDARSAFEMNVHVPRSARRIFPVTEPLGRVPSDVFGSVVEPHRCDSTGLPSVPMIEVMSTIVWSSVDQPPGTFAPPALCSGDRAERRRAVDDAERRCEHMAVRRRRDRDRVRGGARRAGRPEPEVLAVVAGGDHGHDSRERDVVDRLVHRVVRGIGLRAAAREVDDVHPVGDRGLERLHDLGRVRLVAERRRDGEDAVVADPRFRRDT